MWSTDPLLSYPPTPHTACSISAPSPTSAPCASVASSLQNKNITPPVSLCHLTHCILLPRDSSVGTVKVFYSYHTVVAAGTHACASTRAQMISSVFTSQKQTRAAFKCLADGIFIVKFFFIRENRMEKTLKD
ncbi:hypothetical protein ILYODFUR_027199 [Ilyodon furcidens]|uniref:Uncharacterized protein n=1 Tax=Ilyodon furcidens TaxID=33524 RepID=A0ABV0VI70_9TELE